MKSLWACLLLVACAHNPRTPASHSKAAHDSLALGNVEAQAIKTAHTNTTCLAVTLKLTGTTFEEARSDNWMVTWKDARGEAHPVVQERSPASLPVGGQKVASYGVFQEWSNQLEFCLPGVKAEEIKEITLTGKTLTYGSARSLHLRWP